MQPLRNASRRARVRRARMLRRRNDGAAMLVIMLIIIITTAAAAISVQNTSAEIRAVGRERMIIHARYAAEAALNTSIAWVDQLGNSGAFLDLWNQWAAQPPPDMLEFTGGHAILNDASRHMAARSSTATQMQLPFTALPVTDTNNGLDPVPDPTGSFGPAKAYVAANAIVDITDCQLAPASLAPGNQINAGAGGLTPRQFYCVLTVRGRLTVRNNEGNWLTWDVTGIPPPGAVQDRSGVMHDARASILTPSMLMP